MASLSPLPAQELKKGRSAGPSEKYLISRTHLGIYNSVGLSIEYSRRRKGHSTSAVPLESVIFLAVKKTIAQHPCLSYVPAGEETDNPYYVRIPTIDLHYVLSFVERHMRCNGDEDLEFDELLQEQHTRPFFHSEIENPYWRLVILTHPGDNPDFYAAFIFHHSICDTQSASIFHQTFADEFARAEAELQISFTPPQGLVTAPEATMPPSIESLTPFRITPDFRKDFISSIRKPNLSPDHIWTGETARLPVETRYRSFCISASTTHKLARACKESDTTVTAFIQTVIASALFSMLPYNFATLNCNGAISLRHLLPDPPTSSSTMGVFVRPFSEKYHRESFSRSGITKRSGSSSTSIDSNAYSFWSEARRSRQNIKTILADPTIDNPLFAMTLLREMDMSLDEYMTSGIGRKRPVSYEVSNIGRIIQKNQDSIGERVSALEMGRAVFSQSAVASTAPLKISAVTGADGRLNLGFTWQVGSVVASAGDKAEKEEESFVVEGLIRNVRNSIGELIGRRPWGAEGTDERECNGNGP